MLEASQKGSMGSCTRFSTVSRFVRGLVRAVWPGGALGIGLLIFFGNRRMHRGGELPAAGGLSRGAVGGSSGMGGYLGCGARGLRVRRYTKRRDSAGRSGGVIQGEDRNAVLRGR